MTPNGRRTLSACALVFLSTSHLRSALAADIDACIGAAQEGQALRDRGRLIEARESFKRCSQPSCPHLIIQDCSPWLSEVVPRVGQLTVGVYREGQIVSNATMLLDDQPIGDKPLEVNPGRHTLRTTLASGESKSQVVVISDGERAQVSVQFAIAREIKPQAEESESHGWSTRRIVGISLYALAGVGLATAGIVGLSGKQRWHELREACDPFRCRADDVQGTRTAFAVADTLWISSLVVTGVATFLVLTGGSAKSHAQRGKYEHGY
jgi:hypothetical protein